jgi:polysaccharide export outer membrane protein
MKIKNGKITMAVGIALFLFGINAAVSPFDALGQEEMSGPVTGTADEYSIGAGDQLKVVVWKNVELSGDFLVRPDGKFTMPLIGDILAEGNSTADVSKQIVEKLKLFVETPFVSTIVVQTSSNRVFVLGEVKTPGPYILSGPMTVLQALSMAGGFTAFANKEKMVLIRKTGDMQERIPLSYSKILRSPGEENNPVLTRGDTLVVP